MRANRNWLILILVTAGSIAAYLVLISQLHDQAAALREQKVEVQRQAVEVRRQGAEVRRQAVEVDRQAAEVRRQAAQGAQARKALCTFKHDLELRVQQSKDFLYDHPAGIPGITASVIRNGIANQEKTIDSLAVLSCPKETP